jgi:hypothetical protein
MASILSPVLLSLQTVLLVGTIAILISRTRSLTNAIARTQEVSESMRGSVDQMERMSRNILSALEPMSRDMVNLGDRVTEVEGRVDQIEKARPIA